MTTNLSTETSINHKEWTIAQADTVDGYMTLNELAWLYDNAQGDCIEIGSYKGRSATAVALKLKQNGGNLTCVDCWYDEGIYQEFQSNVAKVELAITKMKMRSVEAASAFPDRSLDFIFIDSSHEYQDTVDEILLWLPKLKSTGLLCGHDYGHPAFPGLKQAVHELCYGFENPVDSIWAIHPAQMDESHLHMLNLLSQQRLQLDQLDKLQAEVYATQAHLAEEQANHVQTQARLSAFQQQSEDSLQQLQNELQHKQAKIERVEARLKQSQTRIQRQKAKLEGLQSQLQQAEAEVAAMKTSKFWKMRDRWFKFKKRVGLN